jgi:hypothetical protein
MRKYNSTQPKVKISPMLLDVDLRHVLTELGVESPLDTAAGDQLIIDSLKRFCALKVMASGQFKGTVTELYEILLQLTPPADRINFPTTVTRLGRSLRRVQRWVHYDFCSLKFQRSNGRNLIVVSRPEPLRLEVA